jgi:hypothetical protein
VYRRSDRSCCRGRCRPQRLFPRDAAWLRRLRSAGATAEATTASSALADPPPPERLRRRELHGHRVRLALRLLRLWQLLRLTLRRAQPAPQCLRLLRQRWTPVLGTSPPPPHPTLQWSCTCHRRRAQAPTPTITTSSCPMSLSLA